VLVILSSGICDPDLCRIGEVRRITKLTDAVVIDKLLGLEHQLQLIEGSLSQRNSDRLGLEKYDVVAVFRRANITEILPAVRFDIVVDRIGFITAVRSDGTFFNRFFQKVNSKPVPDELISAESVWVVIQPDDLVILKINVETVLLINVFRHQSSPPFIMTVTLTVITGSGNLEKRRPVLASDTPVIRSFSLPTVELISFWFSA